MKTDLAVCLAEVGSQNQLITIGQFLGHKMSSSYLLEFSMIAIEIG